MTALCVTERIRVRAARRVLKFLRIVSQRLAKPADVQVLGRALLQWRGPRFTRGLTFEQWVVAIETGGLLDVVTHPIRAKYPRQQGFVVSCEGYVHLVPFVEEDHWYFLKTIIPSRKAAREDLKKEVPDHETGRLRNGYPECVRWRQDGLGRDDS